MANPEHLDILRQGVEVWNLWRKENPDIRPDLTQAFLHNASLGGIDLHRADLSRADLIKTNLHTANLARAVLTTDIEQVSIAEKRFILP